MSGGRRGLMGMKVLWDCFRTINTAFREIVFPSGKLRRP